MQARFTPVASPILAVAFAALITLVSSCGSDEEPELKTDTTEVQVTTTEVGATTTEAEVTTTEAEVTTTAPEPEVTTTTVAEVTTEADTTTTEAVPEVTTTEGQEATPVAVTTPPPTLPLAPPCGTWATVEEAQGWMDANGGAHDTSNIDTDGDGRPCTVALAPPTTAAPAPAYNPPAAPAYSPPAASYSGANWDALAACESGGNWATNTGTGFSGGLQFHWQTWNGYGGQQYASAAHLASREQQIAIAEKILADVGRGAWPGCTAAGRW